MILKAIGATLAVLVLVGCRGPGPAGEATAEYTHIPVAGETATAEERAACEAAGGRIERAGLLGFETCIQTYPDAGRSCSDSSQCLGSCLNTGEWVEPGHPVTSGQCQVLDTGFGCTQTVADGIGQPTICVD